MKGSYSITIRNRKFKYTFTVNRNITVIRGEGGSGKTTLCSLVDQAGVQSSGVQLSVVSEQDPMHLAEVLVLTPTLYKVNFIMLQSQRCPTIFLVDETADFLGTDGFAKAVAESGAYFILITRDNYANLPCSTKEIYTITDVLENGVHYRTLQPLYPDGLTEHL